MTTTATLPDLHVPPEVLAEVKRKSAEDEFNNFRECVLEHFPDAVRIDVYLQDDPDEDDLNWVVHEVLLPEEIDADQASARNRAFIHDLIDGRPHVPQPICVLSVQFEGG